MKIGITCDLKTDWVWKDSDPKDANAEFDKPETLELLTSALEAAGHQVKRIGNVAKLLEQIDRLDVDLVFNLCEGRGGRNRESQVPQLLEMKGIPFVGADALCLGITLDKVMAKKCFIADGIPTPKYFIAENSKDLKQLNQIGFPLIVKTRHEGSSKGISQSSRVTDYEGLHRQVDLVTRTYKQTALVEEFIRGSECTVPVIGNGNAQAMPIAQVCINGETFLGDDFYYHAYLSSSSLGYVCPARFPDALTKKIQNLAVAAYKSVDCRDFGRVDFRVDEKGNPYVLEINPLPALGKDDVFSIFPKALGTTYTAIINRVVNEALKRNGLILTKDKVTV